jgi:hypothetical protein
MQETTQSASVAAPARTIGNRGWQKLLPLLITAACFAYLYVQVDRAAARESSGLVPYLVRIFENVSWYRWLALMIPYCIFFS